MKAFFAPLWRYRKLTSMIALAMILLIIFIFIGYTFNWTGFGGGNQITTSRIVSGQSSGTVTQTEVYQQGKTLWDWLQLLIVPAVLAIGGSIISITTSRSEQEATKQRDITERELAADGQREAALQSYLDKMSELLLEKDLRNSQPEDEKRKMARVRTLTALRRLDAERKKVLIQFLHESNLIDANGSIVALEGADLNSTNLSLINLMFIDLSKVNLNGSDLKFSILSGSRLHQTDLRQTDLRQTELSKADISFAHLHLADLRGANLSGANLSAADLREADLREASAPVANLYLANLSKANLGKAFLSHAKLGHTDLSAADLREADLRETDLSEANLKGANLKGANLEGANLSKAVVILEQLEEAKSLKKATMPDGSVHP